MSQAIFGLFLAHIFRQHSNVALTKIDAYDVINAVCEISINIETQHFSPSLRYWLINTGTPLSSSSKEEMSEDIFSI